VNYGALCQSNAIPEKDRDKTKPVFDWIDEAGDDWLNGQKTFSGRKGSKVNEAKLMRREIRRRVGQQYGMGPLATAIFFGLISKIVGMLFEYWWKKRNSTTS
jgi:hypothetical protein